MKEKYTLLLLSFLLVVMLYGITNVLSAGRWTAPQTEFPESSVVAPIDTGSTEQSREGEIFFDRGSASSGISLSIRDGSLIGDSHGLNYFYFTDLGQPGFFSKNPITINARNGFVLPNIPSSTSSSEAEKTGNLVFDSTLNQIKLYANNIWNAIGLGGGFWKQEGDTISYTEGPVEIRSGNLVVNGDIQINETKPKQFLYFPKYNSNPVIIHKIGGDIIHPSNPLAEDWSYNIDLIPQKDVTPSMARLGCDNSSETLDCLSSDNLMEYLTASESDPAIKIDLVTYATGTSILVPGTYAMIYEKLEYKYDYVATKNTNPTPLNKTIHKPRYICDITFSFPGSVRRIDDFGECFRFNLGMNKLDRFPAPPPGHGWPSKVYDWRIGTFQRYNTGPSGSYLVPSRGDAVEEFTRESIGPDALRGGNISFSDKNIPTSQAFSVQSGNDSPKDLVGTIEGNHSFCALGSFLSDMDFRGWCDVYYDYSSSSWKISYGAWRGTKISCNVNCF